MPSLSRLGRLGRLGLSYPVGAAEEPGGYSYSNAEAEALVARMSAAPDDTRKGLIDALVGSLKAAGSWSLMDALYVTAAHNSQAARLNWKGATFDATEEGSPAFTIDRGYSASGGANRLRTGFIWGTSGSARQDDCHMGAYAAVHTTSALSDMGSDPAEAIARLGSTTNARVLLSGISTNPGGAGPHYICGTRRSNTEQEGYRNGASVLTNSSPSGALAGTNEVALCTPGVAASGSTRVIGVFHFGSMLSDQQVLDSYTAFRTYLLAVGVTGI